MELFYFGLLVYLSVGAVLVIRLIDDVFDHPEDYREVSGVFILIACLLYFVAWIVILPIEHRIRKAQERRRQLHHSDIFRD